MAKTNRERNVCSFIGLGTLFCRGLLETGILNWQRPGRGDAGRGLGSAKLRFSPSRPVHHAVMPACWNRNPSAWAESQLCGVDFKCFGTQKFRQEIQMDGGICWNSTLLRGEASSGDVIMNCEEPG